MIVRLVGIGFLAIFASGVQAAPPAEKPGPTTAAVAPERKGEWSEADFKASRERDEQRQKTWDRKMKALTGSVCTGC
jgi:hypothetical protein